ncbi:hypothetical protein [Aliifodinibius sp. S!AR15-10]|nr:hypothetical protein [Aliifodinibius sp. S!AR15-10]
MCKRDECPECGATSLEACHKEPEKDYCAREVIECPQCGATTDEPCLEEA